VKGSGGGAITLNNTIGATVQGNYLTSPSQYGVQISEVSDVAIVDNSFRSTVLSGIRDVIACTRLTIRGNTFTDCATANTGGDNFGIFLQAGGSDYIIADNVFLDANAKMHTGIYLAAGTLSTVSVYGNIVAQATSTGFRLGTPADMRCYRDNYFFGTTAATFNDPTSPVVASAASLTIPSGQDYVTISGNTNITFITPNGHGGRRVTLGFSGTPTVTDGSNLKLAGNFVATADDTITLACDGTNWIECARSVN
jgi:putative cofactor-binding repeat protein